MKQTEEESTMTWKSILERFLDNLGLKLNILKMGNSTDYDVRVAFGNGLCAIDALPGESPHKVIDGCYHVHYPISHAFGHSEEEACSRMLKAIVGNEIYLIREFNPCNLKWSFKACNIKIPRISTSSIHAARISLDMLFS